MKWTGKGAGAREKDSRKGTANTDREPPRTQCTPRHASPVPRATGHTPRSAVPHATAHIQRVNAPTHTTDGDPNRTPHARHQNTDHSYVTCIVSCVAIVPCNIKVFARIQKITRRRLLLCSDANRSYDCVFKIIQALQLGIRTVFHIFTNYAPACEQLSARVSE